jgi:hypothetical protein
MAIWKTQFDTTSEGLKNMLRNREAQRRHEQYVDRGAGTLLDGYSEDQSERTNRFVVEGGQTSRGHFGEPKGKKEPVKEFYNGWLHYGTRSGCNYRLL